MGHIIHNHKQLTFNKINYLDIIIFVSILMTVSVLIYKKVTQKMSWIDARITVSDSELWYTGEYPKNWLLDELNNGDIAYNSFGDDVAVIENIEIISAGADNKQASIDVKLKVSTDAQKNSYFFNYQPLYKGKAISLNFGKTIVDGLIISLGDSVQNRTIKKIKARISYLEPWHAQAYKKDMVMIDSDGNVLARVLDVNLEKSALKPITFLEDRPYLNTREYYDVILDVEASVNQDEEGYYRFVNGASMKVGSEIWFYFPEVEASPMTILELY